MKSIDVDPTQYAKEGASLNRLTVAMSIVLLALAVASLFAADVTTARLMACLGLATGGLSMFVQAKLLREMTKAKLETSALRYYLRRQQAASEPLPESAGGSGTSRAT